MQIPEFKGDNVINDQQLLDFALSSGNYHDNMRESAEIMRAKFEKRKEPLDQQVSELIASVNELLLLREESTDGGRNTGTDIDVDKGKQFKDMRGKIEERYREIMEDYCRLVLDILMYDGTSIIREERTQMIEFESPEVKEEIVGYIEQWQNSIHSQLYMDSKNLRITFRDEMRRRGIKELFDVEDNLKKRQMLIMNSWG